MTLTLRPLTPTPQTMAAIQTIAEGCPMYYGAVRGRPAPAHEARDYFSDYDNLPPTAQSAIHHRLGLYEADTLVGVLDLLQGYPRPEVAYLGWLIIPELRQGEGLGRRALNLLSTHAQQWPGITTLRLAVVANNPEALAFWQHMGFTPTGETKPYKEGTVTSHAILLERSLASG